MVTTQYVELRLGPGSFQHPPDPGHCTTSMPGRERDMSGATALPGAQFPDYDVIFINFTLLLIDNLILYIFTYQCYVCISPHVYIHHLQTDSDQRPATDTTVCIPMGMPLPCRWLLPRPCLSPGSRALLPACMAQGLFSSLPHPGAV